MGVIVLAGVSGRGSLARITQNGLEKKGGQKLDNCPLHLASDCFTNNQNPKHSRFAVQGKWVEVKQGVGEDKDVLMTDGNGIVFR
jgi:hypothetical protein